MESEVLSHLRGARLRAWQDLLQQAGLEPDSNCDQTILLWDGEQLIAAGSRMGNLLKCIAVEESRQGDGLTATLLTALRQEAFREGIDHLFLYTKPQNRLRFTPLFFYPVASTDQVLLMENKRDGIGTFLDRLPVQNTAGPVGSIVMNCDPFTLGHLHLVQTAASECGHVYVFVLSEDRGCFSSEDRLEMARRAVSHLPNVTVYPTGPYLISSATFPTYFLKNRDSAGKIQCRLDIEIFLRYFIPRFQITRRYVGTEPLSALTAQYNDSLKQHLPRSGVEVREIPRITASGNPISASHVRAMLRMDAHVMFRDLLPQTTIDYLTEKHLPKQEVTPCSIHRKAIF